MLMISRSVRSTLKCLDHFRRTTVACFCDQKYGECKVGFGGLKAEVISLMTNTVLLCARFLNPKTKPVFRIPQMRK
jgi:hypothetical protein